MNANLDIPAFLDRRPLVYTYTMLNAYRNCAHAAYRRYILKDQKYVETPQMKWGNDVHTAFEYRISSNKPLPESMRQWEGFASWADGRNVKTELKLGVTAAGHATGYFDATVFLRGKLDTAMVAGEAAYLLDFKTGSSNYEDPFELEIGALLLHAKHPALKTIKAQYAWLKDNRLSKVYDVSDTLTTWNEVQEIVGRIEADRKAGEFEKKRSGLCGWCSVSDCEHYKPHK